MSAVINHGRTIGFSTTPHNGTFPGALTYTALCVSEFPDIGVELTDVEVTDACSTTGRGEFIAGISQGIEFTLTAFYKGSDGSDWGIGASSLKTKAAAGAILGFKQTMNQSGLSAPLIQRFDAVGKGAKVLGGTPNDPMRVVAMFRVTGDVNEDDS